ncbi:MAG: triphosphoribosyl-dephospho-CoA synthase CitG [Clostridia bacterium]|nr:triphosphoribosyl-dephospho-CoA synthase CitG [Clostridia bacterium]
MNVTVLDMMEAREKRAARQRALLAEYGRTLLCFTMNIPGPEKLDPLIAQGAAVGRRKLKQGFLRMGIKPLYQEHLSEKTGCESFYVLPAEPLAVKRMAADIEEAAPLGRLFDLDVLRSDGGKVERGEVGLPVRRCLICGGEAMACARSRTHTVAQLRAATDAILREGVRREKAALLARLACQALLYEVMTTPKPGLVDRENNGSHRDMDIFSFAASTGALYPYFEQCAEIGHSMAGQDAAQAFAALRLPGRMAEGCMLEATGGVNTHRGAVFSVGILCAAAGRLDREQWRVGALLDACAAMTRGLSQRDFAGLTPQNARTAGERLYVAHGITGVRGQAEQGFPLVREHGYPTLTAALQAGLSINDAGCAALIAIMAHNADTNLIHRGGMAAQRETAEMAEKLLKQQRFPDREALREMDQALIRRNLSPGGSADLLAMCYMLYFMEQDRKDGV